MNTLEHQMIDVLKRVDPKDRARVASVMIQSIGPVSNECGEQIKQILAEDGEDGQSNFKKDNE